MNYDDVARAFADALTQAMHQSEADAEQARLAYGALKARGMLKNYRLIEYRCAARRCLLLDVVNLPAPVGLVMHQPRYKQSPTLNAQVSNDSGRARNTEDGDRRWRARTFPKHQAVNVGVNCDHVNFALLDLERVEDDIRTGRHLELIKS